MATIEPATTSAAESAAATGDGASHAADAAAQGAGGHDPLHQFTIERYVDLDLYGLDASFTNAALFMVLALGLITGFLWLATSNRALVPGKLQSIAEMAYQFIAKVLHDIAGHGSEKFLPLVFSLFVFVLVLNLLGMINIPGVWAPFTVTSHIIVTFALAALVFLTVTAVGFFKHGLGFLKLFAPSGVPWPLLLILVPIEVISYLIRPISLSVRLFANMMAGHTLLKVLSGFVVSFLDLGAVAVLGVPVMLVVMVAFTGLEVLIAGLQAFVFAVLSCIYLKDALHMHEH